MRTTLDLDDELLRTAKKTAAEHGITLTRLMEDALRATIWKPEERLTERIELPTFSGRGVRAGVDLTDSAGLLEIMEGDNAAR